MILYSTGYSGEHHAAKICLPDCKKIVKVGKWDAFVAMIERENLVVCDIRLNPWSKAPIWRRANMEAALGSSHYRAIPDLGNPNYKNGDEWAIRNWDRGLPTLIRAAAETQRTPILLCACEDFESCHRSLVAKTLRVFGHTVNEISEWDQPF